MCGFLDSFLYFSQIFKTNAYLVLVCNSSARACRRGSGIYVQIVTRNLLLETLKYFLFTVTKLLELHLQFGFQVGN
jgi:hypothetical protein